MTKQEQIIFDRHRKIVGLIQSAAKTTDEIRKEINMSRVTTDRDLGELHECGEIHVESWRQSRGTFAAVYRAGHAEDAPMPPELAERMRAYRETITTRADQKRNFKAFRHWTDIALFGEYRGA